MSDEKKILAYVWNHIKPLKDGVPIVVPEMQSMEQEWEVLIHLQKRIFGSAFEATPVAERDFGSLTAQIEKDLLGRLFGSSNIGEVHERIVVGQSPASD